MSKTAEQISGVLKHLGEIIKNNVSREFLTYLVFLLLAVVIWYLNALNKNYTTELNFKVRFNQLPDDKILVEVPPDHIQLTVNARGFTLLKYQLGIIFYPININAGHTILKQGNKDPDSYYLYTPSVFDDVMSQLSGDIGLGKISPDTLWFRFSEMIQKNVPVKSLVRMQFEKQYLPKGKMRIEPAVITIAGPRAIIDTMNFVYTKEEKFKKLNDTLRSDVGLQMSPQLNYSVKKVSVTQAIEKHTEATISVPVETINLPEDLKMKTFPGTITVNCMVGISDFEKLQPYLFKAVVDYNSIAESRENQAKLKVSLQKYPEYVSDIRFSPKNVEFIVEK